MSSLPEPPQPSDLPEPPEPPRLPSEFDKGFLVGILVGEGHFGGDGRFPHITLRMHSRHEQLFRWIVATFGGRLYGPYHHGGRSYFQWMARGAELRQQILPLLLSRWVYFDDHIRSRIEAMCGRYSIPLPKPDVEGTD